MNYIDFLGHNGGYFYPEWRDSSLSGMLTNGSPLVNSWGINASPVGLNGFTITTFVDDPSASYLVAMVGQATLVGAVSVGSIYEMPHSPDLKLTMSRESSGTKHIRAKNGASFSNSFYTTPPFWGGSEDGNVAPWELWTTNPASPHKLSRGGRRVWNLSFSYLDKGDVFGSNQLLLSGSGSYGNYSEAVTNGTMDSGDLNPEGHLEYNLLTDDNFYSQVIHKTRGELPFIFQPDGDDKTEFAIAKLDMTTYKFTQVSNSVYSISLKIRECL